MDAGSLFAQYTGDPKVAQRTQYIMDQLRASRDPDGYLGFWNVEPNNYQNVVNWILHEQEYFNLALVRNYRTTGNPQSLADAKVMNGSNRRLELELGASWVVHRIRKC